MLTEFSELIGRSNTLSDIVIVGSGPAALAVAYTLEQHGVSSIMLESGEASKTEQWDVSTNCFKGTDYGGSESYTQLHIRRQLRCGSNVRGNSCTSMCEISMSRTDIQS